MIMVEQSPSCPLTGPAVLCHSDLQGRRGGGQVAEPLCKLGHVRCRRVGPANNMQDTHLLAHAPLPLLRAHTQPTLLELRPSCPEQDT